MTTGTDWSDLVEIEEEEEGQIDEYDLTSTPNDFNVATIFDFIESGAVKIPGFQRNFVWDIKRASKLIESLIIGLPVPQVFLYEEARNSFLVIDGQQRLMTIYYFMKRRFPRKERRAELRKVFNDAGGVPDAVLHDDEYFQDFNLKLPDTSSGRANKFTGLNYSTLGEYSVQFNLRTIRNVIVKQVRPSDDDSSIYEIFGRLNTGGILLTPQEIRLSLYHSKLYDLLFRLNLDPGWRALLGQPEADLHMRDIEVLLRAVAVWMDGFQYTPSMVRFLNRFSREAENLDEDDLSHIESAVEWFLGAAKDGTAAALRTKQSKFGVPLFEAFFAASCILWAQGEPPVLSGRLVEAIKNDAEFQRHAQQKTTDTANVIGRLRRALAIIQSAEM